MTLRVASEPGVASANRDTEMFAEFIATNAPRSFLDVGTGTGYLAIRLALAGCEVAATDLSPRAAALAERNARSHGVELAVGIGDLLDGVTGRYDAISFNPPFSARPDPFLVTFLKKAVCSFEPLERALMHRMPKGVEGFRADLIGRFLDGGVGHLAPGGGLYLLLYSQDLAHLGAEARGMAVDLHDPPALERRNLVFARLSVAGDESTGRKPR